MYCNILSFYAAMHRHIDFSFEKFDSVILTLHLRMNRWLNIQMPGARVRNLFFWDTKAPIIQKSKRALEKVHFKIF